MKIQESALNHGYTHCFGKQIRSANVMRENLRELNRSMESIQKMIEKSRRIINQSRECSVDNHSLEKRKENKRLVIPPTNIADQGQEQCKTYKTRTPYKQINLIDTNAQQSNTKKLSYRQDGNNTTNRFQNGLKSIKKLNINNQDKTSEGFKVRENSESKSKQKGESASPYKEFYDKGRTIYKFSPQKTNNLQSNILKTQPNKAYKQKKRLLSFSRNDSDKQQNLAQPKTHQKQNILIEDEQTLPDLTTPAEKQSNQPRFKTQYSQQEQNDFYRKYKLEQPTFYFQPKPQKKKLNLKLFETQAKKSCIVSQRSKKSTFDSVKISARKNLVKQLEELQTQSTTEQQRKAKFILKIKKYGFVEKHLSQQQIWSIYDQLIRCNVAELKWPIVIVDEVYQKMKATK